MAKQTALDLRLKGWAEVNLAREDADLKVEVLLRAAGWKHTSSTPDSYWMWLKEWSGKTFLVDEVSASRIQEHWDREADYELHPEKYSD